MKIVAFAVPTTYSDKLQAGRSCCTAGDITCIPASKDGYKSQIVNRGAMRRDNFFYWGDKLWAVKVSLLLSFIGRALILQL